MPSEQCVRERCIGETADGKQCRRLARNSGMPATRIECLVGKRMYCERCFVTCVDAENEGGRINA